MLFIYLFIIYIFADLMLNKLTQKYCKNNLKSRVIRYMHEVKMY